MGFCGGKNAGLLTLHWQDCTVHFSTVSLNGNAPVSQISCLRPPTLPARQITMYVVIYNPEAPVCHLVNLRNAMVPVTMIWDILQIQIHILFILLLRVCLIHLSQNLMLIIPVWCAIWSNRWQNFVEKTAFRVSLHTVDTVDGCTRSHT